MFGIVINAKAQSIMNKVTKTKSQIIKEADVAYNNFEEQGYHSFRVAVEFGAAMNAAKEVIGHGEFKPWLEERYPRISYKTCTNYMRLANVQHVAHLGGETSLRKAYLAAGIIQEVPRKLLQAPPIDVEIIPSAETTEPSSTTSFQEQEAAALAAKAVTVPEGSTLQIEVTHGAVAGDRRVKMLLAPDQPESSSQASTDVDVAADTAVSPHAVAKLDATLPPEQRVAVMDALAAAQGPVDVQGDAKLLAETWLATAAGREYLAALPKLTARDESIQEMLTGDNREAAIEAWLATLDGIAWLADKLSDDGVLQKLITTAAAQDWITNTDAGREFDAGLRLRYGHGAIGNIKPLTAAEVDLWCSGCEEGQGWLATVLAGNPGEKQPTISAKTVTAWVLTPDGKKWLAAFNKQHVTAGMKPEPVDKKATKELADIAAGRMVKVPTGPPFTLSHFKSAMETLTALVPRDADHAKFGDMLSTFAAQQLHEARQRKGVTSAYTS